MNPRPITKLKFQYSQLLVVTQPFLFDKSKLIAAKHTALSPTNNVRVSNIIFPKSCQVNGETIKIIYSDSSELSINMNAITALKPFDSRLRGLCELSTDLEKVEWPELGVSINNNELNKLEA